MSAPPAAAALERIREALGPAGCVDDGETAAPMLVDHRGRYRGEAALVVRPGSTGEVAEVVRICAAAGIPVVPQGGNTGLVGGSVPDADGAAVLLSLARLDRVRDLDAANFTVTVEAGCVLADVQAAAADAGLLFPLSLAAEGSCQIGGNLATNAGGTAVLRYGNARDLVLGLEVVLASGEVWNGLRRLRKDNTGYDLKQVFLGSEGTLGIITAAVLKLFPRPRQTATAFAAVTDPAAATRLLARFRSHAGEEITTFEYLDRVSLELVLEHVPDARDPLEARHDHHMLVELRSARDGDDLTAAMERALAEGYEAGEVVDAVIAASEAQRAALWRIRESVPEAERAAGAAIKHDVSVAVSRVPELLVRGRETMLERVPGAVVVAFGHLGDGNVHFNLIQPAAADPAEFLERTAEINRAVHDLVTSMDGSFSAEHGVGRLKRDDVRRYKPEVEVAMMRALKSALDPDNVLNPGKVI